MERERRTPEDSSQARPAPPEPAAERSSAVSREPLARLPSIVGNRAMTQLVLGRSVSARTDKAQLQRDDRKRQTNTKTKTKPKSKPPTAKAPPPKTPPSKTPVPSKAPRVPFSGDGKHDRTDVGYASNIGQADARTLRKTGRHSLSPEASDDIAAKLSWFQGDARDTYFLAIRAPLLKAAPAGDPLASDVRQDLKRQINAWFTQIQKVTRDRIDEWKTKVTEKGQGSLWEAVIAIVIAVLAEGLGGVVYGVVEKMMHRKEASLLQEFIGLAGLEAGDLAAEALLHGALDWVHKEDDRARGMAIDTIKKVNDKGGSAAGVDPGIADKAKIVVQGSAVDTYVAAVRMYTNVHEARETKRFNDTAAAMTDDELLQREAALQMTWEKLVNEPEEYMRQLTAGYLRLLDEAFVSEEAEDYGGDRDKTWREDYKVHSASWRQGSLLLETVPWDYSVGHWAYPDLSFKGFRATGTNLSTDSLALLKGATLGQLPLTLAFKLRAKEPYHGWFVRGEVDLEFALDPDGHIFVDHPEWDHDAEEWLASYYKPSDDEYSQAERERYAPLGARKLFDAMKDKPIVEAKHMGNMYGPG